MNINEFIKQLEETGERTSSIFVRHSAAKKQNVPLHDPRLRELRTKKHDHLALIWDDLGNATVLTKRGTVLNLTANELK